MVDPEFDTYQKRLRFVIARVGGQSELARQATAILREANPDLPDDAQPEITPASIEYLQATERKGEAKKEFKPAQGSSLTPLFAHLGRVEALWLSHGVGPRERKYSLPAIDAADFVDKIPESERRGVVMGFKILLARKYTKDTEMDKEVWSAAKKQAARKALIKNLTDPTLFKPEELPRQPGDDDEDSR